jgi:hypothetical protein
LAAPYGNKNAEKWDSNEALKLFQDAIELTELTETLTINNKEVEAYKYDFIGEVAAALGTYHENFANLYKRFPELKELRKQLNNNIERNCYSNTKRNCIKEATGIVNLKSNWGWTDRQKVEHSGVSVNIMVDDKAKKGIDELIGDE